MAQKAEHYYESETIDGQSELGYRGKQRSPGTPGKSNTVSLQRIFTGAPVKGYSGAVDKMASAADLKQWFFDNVVNGHVDGSAYGLGSFSLDFEDAVDLNKLPTGGDGPTDDMATPYVPNPVSPGEGNGDDATKRAAAPAEFIEKLKPSTAMGPGQHGIDPLRNPSEASKLNKAKPGIAPKSN